MLCEKQCELTSASFKAIGGPRNLAQEITGELSDDSINNIRKIMIRDNSVDKQVIE